MRSTGYENLFIQKVLRIIQKTIAKFILDKFELKEFIELFECDGEEYKEIIKNYLIKNDEVPEILNFNFLRIYYGFLEDTYGRESLNLVEIDKLLESKDPNIIKILGFYDFVLDEEKKRILIFLREIFLGETKELEIYMEGVQILKKIFYKNFSKFSQFIRAAISKSKDLNLIFRITISVLSIVEDNIEELNELKKIVVKEIVLEQIQNQSKELFRRCCYTFLVNYGYSNDSLYSEILDAYYDSNDVVSITGMVDLVLMGKLDYSKIKFIESDSKNEDFTVSLAKLLMAGYIENKKLMVEELFSVYYSTNSECIQQYLSCFFYEYFKRNSELIQLIPEEFLRNTKKEVE